MRAKKISGAIETTHPEFAIIGAGTKAGWAGLKYLWDQMTNPLGTTNTFDASKSGFAKGSTKNERKINPKAQQTAKAKIEELKKQMKTAKTNAEKKQIQKQIEHETKKATQKSEPHGRTSGRH